MKIIYIQVPNNTLSLVWCSLLSLINLSRSIVCRFVFPSVIDLLFNVMLLHCSLGKMFYQYTTIYIYNYIHNFYNIISRKLAGMMIKWCMRLLFIESDTYTFWPTFFFFQNFWIFSISFFATCNIPSMMAFANIIWSFFNQSTYIFRDINA